MPRGDLRLPTGSLDSVKQKGEVPMSAIPIFEVWQSRNMDRPEFCRHSVAALRVAPFKLYR